MRRISAVTVGRSDYGIYLPLFRAIRNHSDLELRVIASGAHLSPEFGLTVEAIEADGFDVDRVLMLLSSDAPGGIARSMGLGMIGYADALERNRPDILVVLGDRFDMYAAAVAALPFKIPVAHIHGGELTQGAIDDALRHSITKLSHLHFVTTDDYAARVKQLGEEPWRVTVCGAPALDHLKTIDYLTADELASRFGIITDPAPLLVTYHPVTLEFEQSAAQMRALLDALSEIGLPTVFTLPNADSGGRIIIDLIRHYVASSNNASVVASFGTQAYFSMMRVARAMVGNSSSGLIEAASFQLPVVNIGNRQRGRVRGANVIDVSNDRAAIVAAIRTAIAPDFRTSLAATRNPYDAGRAASEIITDMLVAVPLNERLIVKEFCDLR